MYVFLSVFDLFKQLKTMYILLLKHIELKSANENTNDFYSVIPILFLLILQYCELIN